MVQRQFPRWRQLTPLLRPRPMSGDRTARRLARAMTVSDLRDMAARRTPMPVFDYTDGAAEDEISLRRARQAFADLEFQPEVLRDVSTIDTTTPMLGTPASVPFSFAPTGFTRMMHTEGESAVVRVAERHGIPYALSTVGTTSIEDLSAVAPTGRKWFQLYVWRDRAVSEDLLARAHAAGFEALILTVDVPVAGGRWRDARSGLTIPPSLAPKTFIEGVRHPGWTFDLLTTPSLSSTALGSAHRSTRPGPGPQFDPSVTIDDLEWVREHWTGPLIVKGVQTLADAVTVSATGADALVLSNHGGRQLDRAPVPLRLVADAREAVGDSTEVWMDTGIMSGGDVVAAIALGAHATMVGRAYLYGLMAGGERGVERAVEILTSDVRRTMALLGVASVSELGSRHVRLP